MAFTAEEIDYLDSRAEAEARRAGGRADDGAGGNAGTHDSRRPRRQAASRHPQAAHRAAAEPTPDDRAGQGGASRRPACRTPFNDRRNPSCTHPDTGHPLRPQHPRHPQRPAAARRPDARRRAVDLRRGQARQPLRALHLHPDHRRPARPAQGGLRALHGRAGPSRIEGKTEFTKHMIRMRHAGPGADPARGQRDHPDQQPRRRELVPDAGGHVPIRLLQRPGRRRRRRTTSASRTRATSRAR